MQSGTLDSKNKTGPINSTTTVGKRPKRDAAGPSSNALSRSFVAIVDALHASEFTMTTRYDLSGHDNHVRQSHIPPKTKTVRATCPATLGLGNIEAMMHCMKEANKAAKSSRRNRFTMQ